jgi:hypothetical protein
MTKWLSVVEASDELEDAEPALRQCVGGSRATSDTTARLDYGRERLRWRAPVKQFRAEAGAEG